MSPQWFYVECSGGLSRLIPARESRLDATDHVGMPKLHRWCGIKVIIPWPVNCLVVIAIFPDGTFHRLGAPTRHDAPSSIAEYAAVSLLVGS